MTFFNRRQALAALASASTTLAMADTSPSSTTSTPNGDDPYLWLEDVQGDKALAWVRAHNASTRKFLEAQPTYAGDRKRLQEILDSKDRIPAVSRRGQWLYNVWKDEEHPRGLWRRTTMESFLQPEPVWETLLDVDALGRTEKTNWVWKAAHALGPDASRCLIALSRGGADATVVREFDLTTKAFVPGGFELPEAKTDVDWLDIDHLMVATDMGADTVTDSGYARTIRLWKRGTPLSSAKVIFEGQKTDVSAFANVDLTPGYQRVVLGRSPDFFSNELALWQDGKLIPIDKPRDAQLSFWRDQVLISLRSDWTVAGHTWPTGSLLIAPAQAYLQGDRNFTALFTPTATTSLDSYTATASQLLLTVLDNVANKVVAWRRDERSVWTSRAIATPFPGALHVQSLHDPMLADDAMGEQFLMSYVDFLTPDALYIGDLSHNTLAKIKSRPAFFDAKGMRVEQAFATSKDGTKVPYFVIWPAGATADGSNPTMLYGYGGFEISLQPWYSPSWGHAWLSRGGVAVVANIRGGGEFGPAWHQAAIKAHKQRSYDDFIAVAEDLIAREITSPRHLGIEGGSNGGLLVGAVMMQRPDLFNGMVCQVPLLDMKRFNKLLAGASWMAEYGNPDVPAEWADISRYSPYQNVHASTHYPRVFFVTSTRDDRVHPGHARKMAAKMMDQGHDVLYYENIEGGHGSAADNGQLADRQALEFAYFWAQLGPASRR